ncbi:Acg family FMN-binding oxidoreductase [Catellatospora bangladeshensis]|uniref:Nitroreductase n=1 Tax=Catellatospora bangladeshensis TaxID=310355 RepID=A0A8J3JPM2_9ACTN|nr:nitroreductase family protein [Catellatospora bangladeshensis]GIF84577.1 hypothetical protein Cba03nite_59260 [Catellatospora bangladeshensis]
MTAAVTLTPTTFQQVVTAAVRAPSLHNSQPWRFRIHGGSVDVCADPARRLPVADPTGRAVRIACGAAAFNARLALAVNGLAANTHLLPDPADPELMARLSPHAARPATDTETALYAAIAERHSVREPFGPAPVPVQARVQIVHAAQTEGAWVELVTGPASIEVISEIVRAAHDALTADEDYRAELRAWTRPDDRSDDGVPAAAGGPSPQPGDLLPRRAFGDRPPVPGMDFDPDPFVVVLGTAGDTAAEQIQAGLALQHVLLTITDAGLAASMLSQPIEVDAERQRLADAFGRDGVPQMVLRVGQARPGRPTPRRGVSRVVDMR